MEEVFDAAFIANESKALVDEEASDGPGRHNRVPPMRDAWDNPRRFEDRFIADI